MKKTFKSVISFVLVLVMALGLFPVAAFADDVTHPVKTGLFERYDYLDFSAGSAGTLYVGEYTTDLHVRRTDLSLGGARMPVTIEFYYDPVNISEDHSSLANPYGIGWNSSYNQTLSYNSLLSRYTWSTSLGTRIEFVYSNQDTSDNLEIWNESKDLNDGLDEAILYLPSDSLETDLDDVIIEYEGLKYTFDSFGRLSSVSDEYSNTANVSYVSGSTKQIDTITDGVGRQYVFCYQSGLLSSVVCKDANGQNITIDNVPVSVSYTYANNTLTDTSEGAHYVYDADFRLTDCWGIDKIGYSLSYVSGTNKVCGVTKKAAMDTQTPLVGTMTGIMQSGLSVTVTEDDTRYVSTFDAYGRVVSCSFYELEETAGISEFVLDYGVNIIYGDVEVDNSDEEVNTIINLVFFGPEEDNENHENDELEDLDDSDEMIDTEPDDPIDTQEDDLEEDDFSEVKDAYGNLLSTTITDGELSQTTSYTYTPDGNYYASITDENGNTQYYDYNTLTGILEAVTDACGNETRYSYNGARELAAASLDVTGLFAATVMETEYSYDSYGRLAELSYGDLEYNFTYDAWGNTLSVSLNGSPLVSYNYGNKACEGQVQSLTYGNGQTVNYTYNASGNITSVGYSNQANRFQYSYAQDGSLAGIYDAALGYTTSYSENTVTVTDAQNHVLYSYSEDAESGEITENIFAAEYVSSSDSSENDQNQSILSKTINREGEEILQSESFRDFFGRLTEKTTENIFGTLENYYSYNQAGSLVSGFDTEYYFGNTVLKGEYAYTYDANGNITRVQQDFSIEDYAHIPNPPGPVLGAFNPSFDSDDELWDLSGSYFYEYDEAGQLVSAADEAGYELRYTYDQSGNIRQVLVKSENEENFETLKAFSYNAGGLLTGYSEGSKYTGYTLDSMGSPVQITVREGNPENGTVLSQKTLSWGEGRMLTGIAEDANNYVSYTYNQDGLRTRKTVCENGISHVTDYIWNNGALIAEKTEDQTITILYGEDGEAEGFVVEYDWYGEPVFEQYAYLKNLQGDVTHVINTENEEVVVAYVYDPWGNPTVYGDEELAAINPCSYRGYYFDEETGWYYLQSRYYNPETGRFLNADDAILLLFFSSPIGQNLYIYCTNNSINLKDVSGDIPQWIITGVIHLALSATGTWSYYNQAKNAISLAAQTYLTIKGYKLAWSLFKHAMWGNGRKLSTKDNNLLISKLKKSSTLIKEIKRRISKAKGNTINKEPLKNLELVGSTKDDMDLYYGLQHISGYIWGTKSNNRWIITISITDQYDFDNLRFIKDRSFASAANDLGWAMQKIGMLRTYKISVTYSIEVK